MKQKILLFAFTLLSTMLFSQAQQKAFLDWSTSTGTQNFFYKNVVKTDGSDVYIAGATMNGSGNLDILVAKYNSSGTQVWIQQYAGTGNGIDFASDMVISGNFVYITGAVTNSTVSPQTDVITMKFNKFNGVVSFVRTYAGSPGLIDGGKSITLDNASSSVLVTGLTTNSSGNSDILTLRYNSSGTLQWARIYAYGANKDDAGLSIRMHTSTNVNVNGVIQISNNVYKQISLSYAVSNGSLSATNISSAVTTNSFDAVTDFAIDNSNNIYLSGTLTSTVSGTNFYVQKLNGSSLASIWTYTFDANGLNDVPSGIELDASNNVYVTGYTTNATTGRNMTLIKLNSSGVFQWNQTSAFNGNDEAVDLVIDSNNDIYITGSLTDDLNGLDFYTAKYNSSGTKIWDIQTDGIHTNDKATNMALDSLNNVIVTGQTEISPGNYVYGTVKYIQREVINPSDLNNEAINPKCLYIPNKGQLLNTNLSNETDVLFYNLSNYPQSYIARNRLSFLQFHRDTLAATADSLERIDMVFSNCKTNDKIYNEDSGTNYDYNFFVGDIKVTGIHAYHKIIATEIYNGIDLHYYSNAYGVKAYFVLKPNANPKLINILLQGQQSATITANNLKITGLLGEINLRKPNVYNINGSINVPATGNTGWAISGNNVSINTGTYNASQPLVIEFSHTNALAFAQLSPTGPTDNLDWCTYYGSTANDRFTRIASDKANNKYMGGNSDDNNYPTTPGVFSGDNLGGTSIVITKFDYLNRRRHSTYYGGSVSSSGYAENRLNGIAVDSLQNIFFVGRTNTSNFPFPLAANQPAGSYHYTTNPANTLPFVTSYVVKLDSAMQNNLWGTHIGNSAISHLNDVMVDKNQNVTVVGYNTTSGTTFNFPTPPSGAYYNTQGQGLLFRFSNNGLAQYATRTSNQIIRIAENKINGDYFIATKLYTNDPGQKFKNPGGGAYYDSLVYLNDFYLARFNNQDSITWATVFGGIHNETVYDMAIKDSILILAGTCDGVGFPIKYAPGQYVDSIHTNIGPIDQDVAFVRFNSYTGKHVYSSYYGGQEQPSGGIDRDDYPTACIIDDNGNYFISGNTSSDIASGYNLMQANGFYYSGTYYGNNSGFLISYTPNNDLRLSTYFGGRPYHPSSGFLGSNDTYMSDMVISNGKLFVAGTTNANRYFPIYDASNGVAYMDTMLTSPTGQNSAYTDGFVASFSNLAFVGIHNIDKNEVFGNVLVYPNPSSGNYTIEINGLLLNKNITFNVYNTLGQIVYKEEAKTDNEFIVKQINLNSLIQGVYFINIIHNNKSFTAKVIKQ